MYVGISMVSVMDHEPGSLKTNVMVMDHDKKKQTSTLNKKVQLTSISLYCYRQSSMYGCIPWVHRQVWWTGSIIEQGL